MIQLYAKFEDLTPTEPHDYVFSNGETMDDRIRKHKESILEGWQYCKLVNPDGTLRKGNATYWICDQFREDFPHLNYVPIDFDFFTGLASWGDILHIRDEIIYQLLPITLTKKALRIKPEVIPDPSFIRGIDKQTAYTKRFTDGTE